mmetsp:Transcript_32579/g.85858  ORF Transcript_32579/g.85858 Transcript_32579/m.85858 type:complete len:209 (-) Transcript_32579:168-794(-)
MIEQVEAKGALIRSIVDVLIRINLAPASCILGSGVRRRSVNQDLVNFTHVFFISHVRYGQLPRRLLELAMTRQLVMLRVMALLVLKLHLLDRILHRLPLEDARTAVRRARPQALRHSLLCMQVAQLEPFHLARRPCEDICADGDGGCDDSGSGAKRDGGIAPPCFCFFVFFRRGCLDSRVLPSVELSSSFFHPLSGRVSVFFLDRRSA